MLFFSRLTLTISVILFAAHAFAADAPNTSAQPLKLLIGFAAGGSADTVARIMAPRMSEALKQSIVIDNRAGAGGNIATEALVKSAPDGNTIMLGTIGSLAVNQHLKKLSYDPVADSQALSMAVVFTNILVVNAKSEIRTLEDYVREAKKPETRLSFGSSGVGSSGHLAGEFLKSVAGLNNEHVAYRGGAPAMTDLVGGVLPSIFSSPTDALQHINVGSLRAIATTGAKRLEALPNVPTIAESGYPGFEAANWYAFVAPKATPPAVVQRLNAAIVVALTDPAVVAQLRKNGLDPAPTKPDEASKYIRSESEKWGGLARKIGLKSE